ncbi:hypothetical protein HERIO_1161 [Hepatospora eriocheir]|uniref:Uncharacterized protein n=1 Tax=Hepatospora eriocheir TaxID=1081669 RepID=A0A1X0QAY7_9MICR|nr:hypothetical protein HERIO_1161 [Hepatospora eriocheir]
MTFSYLNSIPIQSNFDLNDIYLNDDKEVYFVSNGSLFSYLNKLREIDSCESDIVKFRFYNDNAVLVSESRIYFNFGSLKRMTTAFDLCENLFALGTKDDFTLEVWSIPDQYKFTLFDRVLKINKHTSMINCVKIYQNFILSSGLDRSIFLTDINTGNSNLIWKSKDLPVYVNFINKEIESSDLKIVQIEKEKVDFKLIENKKKYINCLDVDDLECVVVTEKSIIKIKKVFNRKNNDENINFLNFKGKIICADCNKNRIVVVLQQDISSELILFNNDLEELYRGLLSESLFNISLNDYSVALKFKNKISVFDVQAEALKNIPLPVINDIDVKKNVLGTACNDNYLRLYSIDSNNRISFKEYFDQNFKGNSASVKLFKNSAVMVSDKFYVSLFNVDDGNCYRSYNLPIESDESILKVELSEDGIYGFFVTKNRIINVELKKANIVNSIVVSNLIKAICYRDNLYYVNLENELFKWNPFSDTLNTIQITKMVKDLYIEEGLIGVMLTKEIEFYNLNLKFNSSLPIINKKEIKSIKEVKEGFDKFSFNNKNIIIARDKLISIDRKTFKRKVFYEFTGDTKIIKMIATIDMIFVISNKGISIFKKSENIILPVNINIESNPDFIKTALSNKEYLKALLGSLRLGEEDLIVRVLRECDNLEIYKVMDETYTIALCKFLVNYIEKYNSDEIFIFKIVNVLVKFKRECINEFKNLKCDLNEKYKIIRDTYFMLKSLVKKNGI